MEKQVVIATHDGMFHSDDVFAVAILLLALDSAPVITHIVRTRDEDVIRKADFVADVGGVYDAEKNRFDHHQVGGAGKRGNGVPFAAFGLVWKKFGKEVSGNEEIAGSIDVSLVSAIDSHDSGVDIFTKIFPEISPYLVQDVIQNYRPTWQEPLESVDEKFLEAVAFAKKTLERQIITARATIAAKDLVEKAYLNAPDKRIVSLDGFYPSEKTLSAFSEPLFSVSPRPDGLWNVRAIRSDSSTFKNRKDLPENWAGKRDAELAEITGVSDAVFCHNGRFMAVAKSKEGAIKLAELALNS